MECEESTGDAPGELDEGSSSADIDLNEGSTSADIDLNKGSVSAYYTPIEISDEEDNTMQSDDIDSDPSVMPGIEFKIKSAIDVHDGEASPHTNTTTPRVKCKCKTCITMEEMNENLLPSYRDPEISCSQCPLTFQLKQQIKMHQIMHSIQHPYKCSLCHLHAYVYR